MRTYDKTTKKLIRAVCNCCGRELKVENGALYESICSIDCEWGYFSDKDMECHQFDLCEACYDKLMKTFAIPPQITVQTEFPL